MERLTTSEQLEEYRNFLCTHPKCNFMQSLEWGQVKENWQKEVLVVRDAAGQIRSGIQIFIRKAPGLPISIFYAPRGPVAYEQNEEDIHDLLSGVRTLAKEYHAYSFKIDPDVEASDHRFRSLLLEEGFIPLEEHSGLGNTQPKFVSRLDIAGKTMDQVFMGFTSKARYNTRVARRKGVAVRVAGIEDLPVFYELLEETGRRDGFPVRRLEYYERLLRKMGPHARLYLADYQGQTLSGAIAISYGDRTWYLYGASTQNHREVMPNYLLQYEMIRWAVEQGHCIYDFRGISGDLSKDNPLYGLYRFKRGFGCNVTELTGEYELVLNRPLYRLAGFALALRHQIKKAKLYLFRKGH